VPIVFGGADRITPPHEARGNGVSIHGSARQSQLQNSTTFSVELQRTLFLTTSIVVRGTCIELAAGLLILRPS
jgi:hypothetical protein